MKLNNEAIKYVEKKIQKAMKLNFKDIGEDGYIVINRKGAKISSLKSCKHKDYNSLCIMYNAYILNLLSNYQNLSKKEKETLVEHAEVLKMLVRGII